jgi:hypothetical protein
MEMTPQAQDVIRGQRLAQIPAALVETGNARVTVKIKMIIG